MRLLKGEIMSSKYMIILLAIIHASLHVSVARKTTMTAASNSKITPTQIHLSIADDPLDMMVSWITIADSDETFVQYGIGQGPSEPWQMIEGSRFSFLSGRTQLSRRMSHRVLLSQLHPDTRYWYRCGGPLGGWSSVFTFKSFPSGAAWQPTVALMGDLGTAGAHIVPLLINMTASEQLKLVVHLGDIAYNMETFFGKVGDTFFENIEPVAANIPYMICPGNHDNFGNFTNIKNRFSMPGQFDNFYYTFKMGPILFISISTELYYPSEDGTPNQVSAQYRWLEEVLIKANQNRDENPWIILYGHRAMYCNIITLLDCLRNDVAVRVGSSKTVGLEPLLFKYGVDLAFWGHSHVYERTFPVYNNEILNGSVENPYENPGATVHVISGCAGSIEGKHFFRPRPLHFSAFRSRHYGFSLLQAMNNTHLHIQYVDQENEGKILDDIWIVQDHHGPFEKANIS